MTEHTIGIDISRSHLDAFRREDEAASSPSPGDDASGAGRTRIDGV